MLAGFFVFALLTGRSRLRLVRGIKMTEGVWGLR